jgi:hypothetical protein
LTNRVYFKAPELQMYELEAPTSPPKSAPANVTLDKHRSAEESADFLQSDRDRMLPMQKADVFSLGVLIYWVCHNSYPKSTTLRNLLKMMTAREFPFKGSPEEHQKAVRMSSSEPHLFSDLVATNHPAIHPQLFQLLYKCWQVEASDRPSVKDLFKSYLQLPREQRAIRRDL